MWKNGVIKRCVLNKVHCTRISWHQVYSLCVKYPVNNHQMQEHLIWEAFIGDAVPQQFQTFIRFTCTL